jgi:hypothetical protein
MRAAGKRLSTPACAATIGELQGCTIVAIEAAKGNPTCIVTTSATQLYLTDLSGNRGAGGQGARKKGFDGGLGRLDIVGKVSEEIAPAQGRTTVIRLTRCGRADFLATDVHLKRRKRRGSRFASVSDVQLCTAATASRHLAPVLKLTDFVKLKST